MSGQEGTPRPSSPAHGRTPPRHPDRGIKLPRRLSLNTPRSGDSPAPWAAHSNVQSLFSVKNFLLMSNLSFPWRTFRRCPSSLAPHYSLFSLHARVTFLFFGVFLSLQVDQLSKYTKKTINLGHTINNRWWFSKSNLYFNLDMYQ